MLLLTGLAAFLLLLPAALRTVWLKKVLIKPLLWPLKKDAVPHGQARIWLLDVGQGQAIIVQTATHALAYDTGPAMGGVDAGEMIVVPFLRGEGIRYLDRMILSHADADHAGGAEAILQQVAVGAVISGEAERHQNWQAQSCAEQAWEWDGVQFWQWQQFDIARGNAASCVLLVDADGERFLVKGFGYSRRASFVGSQARAAC